MDEASQAPIKDEKNIMYTLHYYAGTHKEELRAKAETAIKAGLPLFVTEYGTVNADGGGAVDEASSKAWWDFLDKNKVRDFHIYNSREQNKNYTWIAVDGPAYLINPDVG